MRQRLKNSVDFILTSGFIIAIFLVYFKVSREWAIYVTAAAIIFILFTYIPHIKSYYKNLNARSLIKELKKYKVIREPSLIQNTKFEPGFVHRQLYLLSKEWDEKPLILYVKNY